MKLYKSFCPCHPHLWLWNMDPAWWLKKGSRLSKPSAWGNFSASPTWSTRPTGWGARSISLWVHRNLFWHSVKRWKLAWFGRVMCHDSLSKTILQGTLDGVWRHDRQRQCWIDNIERTSLPMPELLTRASCRKGWKRIYAESSLISPEQPNLSKDWTELKWREKCQKKVVVTLRAL